MSKPTPTTSLDGRLAQFTEELNAATTQRAIDDLCRRNEAWITALSIRGQQQAAMAIQQRRGACRGQE